MKKKELAKLYRVADQKKFRLGDADPGDTWKMDSKEQAEQWLGEGVDRLKDLQDRLYAQNQWALLLVFQAMDAAGKDGTIKHVMSGVNPQGCQVYSFKAPSAEELDHDFLWRDFQVSCRNGTDRHFQPQSYYEEVLVVRVHPEILSRQKLPSGLITKDIWRERFEDINAMERHLTRNGVVICKFFLHRLQEEQKRRLLERLEVPEKNWKFSADDIRSATIGMLT